VPAGKTCRMGGSISVARLVVDADFPQSVLVWFKWLCRNILGLGG
jgi:hypothetical protein